MYKRRYCFVPGCRTGYASDSKLREKMGLKVPTLFSTPKDLEIFEQWQKAVPQCDKIFGKPDVICALHFREEYIVRFFETKLIDGSIHKIPRQRITLKPGSVPSIFPISSKTKRKLLSCDPMLVSNKKNPSESRPEIITNAEVNNFLEIKHFDDFKKEPPEMCISYTFEKLKSGIDSVCFPNKQWSSTLIEENNVIIIAQWSENYAPKKRVIIHKDMSYKVLFGNSEIHFENECVIIKSSEDLENLLKQIDNMRICPGVKLSSISDTCHGVIQPPLLSNCDSCKAVIMKKRQEETKQLAMKKQLVKLKDLRYIKRKNQRLVEKVQKLRNCVEKYKKQCATIAAETIEASIANLPAAQQEAVKMCFAAARVSNPKNMRYTLAWIYECNQFRIKSKAAYEHLRNHKLLPLPDIKTLNSYINKCNDSTDIK